MKFLGLQWIEQNSEVQNMFNNLIAVLMNEDVLIYELYEFRGHLFRVYPSGKIGRADYADNAFYKGVKR